MEHDSSTFTDGQRPGQEASDYPTPDERAGGEGEWYYRSPNPTPRVRRTRRRLGLGTIEGTAGEGSPSTGLTFRQAYGEAVAQMRREAAAARARLPLELRAFAAGVLACMTPEQLTHLARATESEERQFVALVFALELRLGRCAWRSEREHLREASRSLWAAQQIVADAGVDLGAPVFLSAQPRLQAVA